MRAHNFAVHFENSARDTTMTPKPHLLSDEDEQDIFFNIINRFIGYFSRNAQRESQNDPAGEYPFVAMDTRQVYEQLRFVAGYLAEKKTQTENWPPTFIDIGCGIGNVMLIAEQFGFDVFGLEKDPYPAAIAAQLFSADRVFQSDIFAFPDYARFDVIYYFRPFSQARMQSRFELTIETSMKPGAILIANHTMDKNAYNGRSDFKSISSLLPIWERL